MREPGISLLAGGVDLNAKTRGLGLPSLDAHAHLDVGRSSEELAASGAVLAMTLSLEEASGAVGYRREPLVVWGVGCHPRRDRAQELFDPDRFRELAKLTPVIGEIGLDTRCRTPLELQLQTFRAALGALAGLPRLVSIHAYEATGLVLEELRRNPVSVPVLHWWTGTVAETSGTVLVSTPNKCSIRAQKGTLRQRTREQPSGSSEVPDSDADAYCPRVTWGGSGDVTSSVGPE